jgi:hypothetical protein
MLSFWRLGCAALALQPKLQPILHQLCQVGGLLLLR